MTGFWGISEMSGFVNAFAQYLRSNINEICFGITAVAIMLSGPHLTSILKRFTIKLNWFLRYCIFIILCTVGIGFLSKTIFQGLKYWFTQQGNAALVLWVPAVYLGLAWYAKQKKEI